MDNDLSGNRQQLVAEIIVDARRTADLTGREVFFERARYRARSLCPRAHGEVPMPTSRFPSATAKPSHNAISPR